MHCYRSFVHNSSFVSIIYHGIYTGLKDKGSASKQTKASRHIQAPKQNICATQTRSNRPSPLLILPHALTALQTRLRARLPFETATGLKLLDKFLLVPLLLHLLHSPSHSQSDGTTMAAALVHDDDGRGLAAGDRAVVRRRGSLGTRPGDLDLALLLLLLLLLLLHGCQRGGCGGAVPTVARRFLVAGGAAGCCGVGGCSHSIILAFGATHCSCSCQGMESWRGLFFECGLGKEEAVSQTSTNGLSFMRAKRRRKLIR